MKFITGIFFVLLAFTSMATEKQCVITGNTAGLNNKKVELVRTKVNGSWEILATDTIINHRFKIVCKVDEISFVRLRFSPDVTIHFGDMGVILEEGNIRYTLNEDGSSEVSGGKYNELLYGYKRTKPFIDAQNTFRKLTGNGDPQNVFGTEKEWDAVQGFLKMENIRMDYLANIVFTNKDPYARIIAAVMNELQPERVKTMKVVNELAPILGEKNEFVLKARQLDKSQAEFMAMRQSKATGTQYSNFSAINLKGDSVTLEPIVRTHTYTLLQFWASWCGPCRREIPMLKTMYAKYKSKGFEIVSFSMDERKSQWEKASQVEKLDWHNWSDLLAFKSPLTKQYPINGIPANVIIDQTGKIVACNLMGDELEAKIQSLFKGHATNK